MRKVNRRVLEALIRAGALDAIQSNRAGHLAELTTALRVAEQHGKMAQARQNDMFGLVVQVENSDEDVEAYTNLVEPWSEKEKLDAEKQTLGLFLTGHPIAEYLPELKYFTNGTLASLQADAERSKGKMEGRVAGLIVEMRTRQTKQGKMMGFATLDDRTGRLEVAAFSGIYDKYRDLLSKDTLLIAEGALNIDEFTNNLRLTAEKLYSMEQAREMFARGIVLKWNTSSWPKDRSFSEALSDVLTPFCGGLCPISIDYSSSNARVIMQLDDNWRVRPSDELLIRLRRLLGVDSVQVKYQT